MKKFYSLSIVAIAAILLFSSCDKDQMLINQLNGSWKVTSLKINGTESAAFLGVDDQTTVYTKCKAADGYCPAVVTDPSAGTTDNYEWSISGDGTIFHWRDAGASSEQLMTITDHSSTIIKMTYTYDLGGTTYTVEIVSEKQ